MTDENKIFKKIGFIGGGNMSKAIAAGIVAQKVLPYKDMVISCRSPTSLEYWKKLGAQTTLDNNEVVDKTSIVFLGIKPNMLSEIIKNLNVKYLYEKIIISMLAGVSIKQIIDEIIRYKPDESKHFRNYPVIRMMPNTPLAVGAGCTVFSCSEAVSLEAEKNFKTLLAPSGICEEVPENLINAVGAVAGSSPAFIYTIIEAMADGGVKMGLPRQMAIKYAAQATYGAAKMVLETGKHTGVLKDEICSPGGTTITGIHAMEKGGVRAAMIDAIECTTKRAHDMQSIKK